MHYTIGLLIAVGWLMAACSGQPVAAEPPTAVDRQIPLGVPPDQVADIDTVVCKDITKTGTRFRSRQCLKESQWAALKQRGRDTHEDIQRRAGHQQDMPGQ